MCSRRETDLRRWIFRRRNLYRTAVEQLARGSGFTELEVADAAVVAARRAYRVDAKASDARLARIQAIT